MYYIGLHDNPPFYKTKYKYNTFYDHAVEMWAKLHLIQWYILNYTPEEANIKLSSQYTLLIGSDSILYKILKSVNVDTFKVFIRALTDRSEKLRLTSQYDFMAIKKIITLIHIRKYIYNVVIGASILLIQHV